MMLSRLPSSLMLLLFIGWSAASAASDGLLPVKAERKSGLVRQIWAEEIADIRIGAKITPGASVFSAADGRVELSLNEAPTLSMGGNSAVLMHSANGTMLRAALTSGTLVVDTRAKSSHPARDVRLNVGVFRARIEGARVWAEKTPEYAQLCLLDGEVTFRANERPLKLDVEGQCVRQLARTRQWNIVAEDVLADRVAMTRVTLTRRLVAQERAQQEQTQAAALADTDAAPALPTPLAPTEAAVETGAESESGSEAAEVEIATAPEPSLPVEPPPAEIELAAAPPTPALPTDRPEPAATEAPVEPTVKELESSAEPESSESTPAMEVGIATEPDVTGPAPESVQAAPEALETVPTVEQLPMLLAAAAPFEIPVEAEPTTEAATETLPEDSSVALASQAAPQAVIEPSLPIAESEPTDAPVEAPAPEAKPAKPPRPWVEAARVSDQEMASPGVQSSGEPVSGDETLEAVVEETQSSAAPEPTASTASTAIEPPAELGTAGVAVAMAVEARQQAIASGEIEKVRPPGEIAATGDDRRWSIVVASMDDIFSAREEVERLREKGLDVEARPFKSDEDAGYRIGIGRYEDESMARAALKAILEERPLLGAWLARY